MLGSITSFIFAYRQEGPLRLTDFDRHSAAGLLSYGGWVSVSSIINPILTSFDQMLIGAQLGVVAVAHYAVAMTLVLRSQNSAGSLGAHAFSSAVPPRAQRSFFARRTCDPFFVMGLRSRLRPRNRANPNFFSILDREGLCADLGARR